MPRHEDWPEQLAAKLAEWRERPFEWGTADCLMFVADVVRALTGADPASVVRGQYASERGALRTIRAHGADLTELVTRKFGAPIAVTFAQRGDVLLHENNLGICLGEAGAFRTPAGLLHVPLLECERAWRVE